MLNTKNSLLDIGFERREKVISGNILSELRVISDVIVKFGLMLRIVGLGNRSLRNSTVFTGNLVLNHPLFPNVLQKVTPIAVEALGADRKGAGWGNSVDSGGRRTIKKKRESN